MNGERNIGVVVGPRERSIAVTTSQYLFTLWMSFARESKISGERTCHAFPRSSRWWWPARNPSGWWWARAVTTAAAVRWWSDVTVPVRGAARHIDSNSHSRSKGFVPFTNTPANCNPFFTTAHTLSLTPSRTCSCSLTRSFPIPQLFRPLSISRSFLFLLLFLWVYIYPPAMLYISILFPRSLSLYQLIFYVFVTNSLPTPVTKSKMLLIPRSFLPTSPIMDQRTFVPDIKSVNILCSFIIVEAVENFCTIPRWHLIRM